MVLSLYREILCRKTPELRNQLNFTSFSCLKSRYFIKAYRANLICFRETGHIAASLFLIRGWWVEW